MDLKPDYLRDQAPGAVQLKAAGGAASVPPELAEALDRLMTLFNVHDVPALLAAGQRLVERLRKLDDVLPRYQRMAAQTFELLRVRSLDEVVPALRARLGVAA